MVLFLSFLCSQTKISILPSGMSHCDDYMRCGKGNPWRITVTANDSHSSFDSHEIHWNLLVFSLPADLYKELVAHACLRQCTGIYICSSYNRVMATLYNKPLKYLRLKQNYDFILFTRNSKMVNHFNLTKRILVAEQIKKLIITKQLNNWLKIKFCILLSPVGITNNKMT